MRGRFAKECLVTQLAFRVIYILNKLFAFLLKPLAPCLLLGFREFENQIEPRRGSNGSRFWNGLRLKVQPHVGERLNRRGMSPGNSECAITAVKRACELLPGI